MKVDRSVVAQAREGSLPAAAAIVRAYEGSLYALALASTRSPEEAEDAVQETFAKLLAGLRDLREAGRFEAWLFALARHELASRGRSRARAAARLLPGLDPDELPAAEGAAGEAAALLGPLFARLTEAQAQAIALRYGAGLSVAETALACGIPASVAKSRLHEALERMRSAAFRAASGGASAFDYSGFRIPAGMEERIMENVELLRLGARVIERMALCDQVGLARLAKQGGKMDASVLEAMGKIEGGAELVRRTAAAMDLRELGAFLNYADRYTEMRVVEELERVDLETAEALKDGMFVFEDFVLFDGQALALVVGKAGIELFAQGLAGCQAKERGAILELLDPLRAAELRAALARLDFGPELSRAAQQEAISIAHRLDHEGAIETLRGEEAGPRGVIVRLAR